jgi:hypothetical protein
MSIKVVNFVSASVAAQHILINPNPDKPELNIDD